MIQRMMEYVIDLEAYSMLIRPQHVDTEIIQFRRDPYTVDAGEHLCNRIRQCLRELPADSASAAPFVFVLLFACNDLIVLRGVDHGGGEHWLVRDLVSDRLFDFSNGGEALQYATLKPWPGLQKQGAPEPPIEACMDLLQQVQPSAQRYVVGELITPQNKADSEFIRQKQAMDYLYQNGVFGKFDS